MQKKQLLKQVDALLKMYDEGLLGGEVMPEDSNPHLPKDSLENYLYFTLPMALNYQRNSYTLWQSAFKTYQDESTRFVFSPKECVKRGFAETQKALVKYRVALQKEKQTEIWLTLCQTMIDFYDGDIRKLFDSCKNDVNRIRDFIQIENRKKFPYLAGTKICNYWLYVIYQYTDRRYQNMEDLTVAADTHVCKATYRLGLLTEEEFASSNVQKIVIERWKEALAGTKYKPIDVHTPLWLWSRNGFIELTKYTMLDRIVLTSREVMKQSTEVSIALSKIEELAKEKIPPGKHWGESNAFGFMDYDIQTIVHFLLAYQSIDFSFWGDNKWKIETKDYGVLDGSQALMYVFLQNISLFTDFKKLAQMKLETFRKLLQGENEIPLLEERYHIVKQVATIVNEKMAGNFYRYIQKITDDRELFNVIIENFPSFQDERTYMGKTVYFYKLASLLTSDIMHLRNQKEKPIFDYSHIVGCSDYKIPQIMRSLGLLKYSKELAFKIDHKIPLPDNSKEEVEIRSATIVVLDMLRKKTGLCGMAINDFLWLKSQTVKDGKPYHLTRTTNY